MGGYKERTIRLEFPDLGKGCYAVIKNPALQPLITPLALPDEWTPQQRMDAAMTHQKAVVGNLVLEWNVWDVDAVDDVPLPLPTEDPTVLDRCPGLVLNRIGEEVERRTNPTRTPDSATTKS